MSVRGERVHVNTQSCVSVVLQLNCVHVLVRVFVHVC